MCRPPQSSHRLAVTGLSVDKDSTIPGLAELADAMQRHGKKSARIQHSGALSGRHLMEDVEVGN